MSNQFHSNRDNNKTFWLVFGCIILLHCINGTSSIYQSCSSLIKHNYKISNLQLNYLIVAYEFGRLFMYFPVIASEYLPVWMILLTGLVCGLIGYGVQYLHMVYKTPYLSYWQVVLLNALGGISTCWIRTYCHLLAVNYFGKSHMTVGIVASNYSVLNGRVYTSILETIRADRKNDLNSITYLLLTCLAPAVVGLFVPAVNVGLKFVEYGNGDGEKMLPLAFVIAIITGGYALVQSVVPTFIHLPFQFRAVILLLVLTVPFVMPLAIAAHQFVERKFYSDKLIEVSSGPTAKGVDKKLKVTTDVEIEAETKRSGEVRTEGNENDMIKLLMNLNFWLFFLANACGAALGMIYANNLTRISESHNSSEASLLVSISSTVGYLGRIISVLFDTYTRERKIIPNSALMVLTTIPMPTAFFLLMSSSNRCLYISTVILGTCSGALNIINASITRKLFGSKNLVLTQTLIHISVPVASLLFGSLAAINYEKESKGTEKCIGIDCYYLTFIFWGSICIFGAIQGLILHLRTRSRH